MDTKVPDESSMKNRYNMAMHDIFCTCMVAVLRENMNIYIYIYFLFRFMILLNSMLRFLCPFLRVPKLTAKKTTCEVSDASTMTPGHLLLTSLLKSKVPTAD